MDLYEAILSGFFVLRLGTLIKAQELKSLYTYGGDLSDVSNLFKKVNDSEFLIFGTTKSYGNGSQNYYILKVDTTGDVKWSKYFLSEFNSQGIDIIKTSNDEIMLLGNAINSNGNSCIELLEISDDQSIIWKRKYGLGENLRAVRFVETSDKEFIILAAKGNGKEIKLFKINENGDIEWINIIANPNFEYTPLSLTVLEDGNYIMSGWKSNAGSSYTEGYLMKLDKDGKKIWDKSIANLHLNVYYNISVANDNSFYVSGQTIEYQSFKSKIILSKFSKSGDLLFSNEYEDDGYFVFAKELEIIKNGKIFLLCSTSRNGGDILLIAVDKDGSELTRSYYGGAELETPRDLEVIDEDNLCIVGNTKSYGQGDEDIIF